VCGFFPVFHRIHIFVGTTIGYIPDLQDKEEERTQSPAQAYLKSRVPAYPRSRGPYRVFSQTPWKAGPLASCLSWRTFHLTRSANETQTVESNASLGRWASIESKEQSRSSASIISIKTAVVFTFQVRVQSEWAAIGLHGYDADLITLQYGSSFGMLKFLLTMYIQ
jgi:hypothetical protein